MFTIGAESLARRVRPHPPSAPSGKLGAAPAFGAQWIDPHRLRIRINRFGVVMPVDKTVPVPNLEAAADGRGTIDAMRRLYRVFIAVVIDLVRRERAAIRSEKIETVSQHWPF